MLSICRQVSAMAYKASFRYIPPYTPTKPINYESIKLPPRPKLDVNDPTEVYKIARMPRRYSELRNNFKRVHTIGTQSLSVAKDGRVYHLFDASRVPFGRMCQRIAWLIQGRHKPTYKHNETGLGDICVVVNAENIRFTGKKIYSKKLIYHTGYIGHVRQIEYSKLIKEKPEQLISWGVWKQLPKNRLRMQHLEFLDIFRTREHTYTSILPQILPRPVTFRYDTNLYEQALEPSTTIIYRSGETNDNEVLAAKKVQPDPDNPAFIPFALRDTDIKYDIGAKRREVIMRAHLKQLKRHRRHYAQKPRVRDRTYNPEWTYIVTSERQLKQLKLQDREPLDEDPEIEEENIK